MTSPQYLSPVPLVENIDPEGLIKGPENPRCSLDFIIRTPTGVIDDDYLQIEQFTAQETVSQPFEYKVELRANDTLSQEGAMTLKFADIIGSSATIRLGLPENDDDLKRDYPANRPVTFFNGVVTSFSFKQSGVYECVMRPKLWRLGLSNDYRLYTQTTIKLLIESILKKHQLIGQDDTECLEALDGPAVYRTQDWLQAGESDLDFVNRLLEKVNGYYYFIHDDNNHKIKFANKPAYCLIPAHPDDAKELECAPLYYTFGKVGSLDEDNRLLDFSYEQHLVPGGSQNILAQPQAAWEEDTVASLSVCENNSQDPESDSKDTDSPAATPAASPSERSVFKHYRVYQYGVTPEEANALNALEERIIKSGAYRLTGQSTCPKLKPGHVFCTKQHKPSATQERADVALMRPDLDDKQFVVINVQHQANVNGSYSNSLTAVSATGCVLDHNPQQNRVGSVYGRVVNPPAPDSTKSHEAYSHNMLGRGNFGPVTNDFSYSESVESNAPGVHTCQGVYVEFEKFPGLKGENGHVWIKLAEHMQTVPEEGATVLVGRSSDDTDVPEIQSVVQQKGNSTILKPDTTTQSTSVGNNYSTSYGDSRGIRYGNKSATNLPAAIKAVDAQYGTGNFKDVSYSLGASYSYSAPNNADDQTGLLSKSLSYGSTHSEHHGALSESTSHTGTSNSISTVGVSNSTSEVGTSNSDSLVGISNSTSLTGVQDSTSAVGLSDSISATGIQNSASATGIQNAVSVTGSQKSASATGRVNSASVTGSSFSISATGQSDSLNGIGVSNSMAVTGASKAMNVTGSSNSLQLTGSSKTINVTGSSDSLNAVGSSFDLSGTLNSTKISAVAQSMEVSAHPIGQSINISPDGIDIKLTNLTASIQFLRTKMVATIEITM